MTTLKRTISLPFLACYGLGTILGAGIYVLVGKVAGLAGLFAPISFLLAAIIAGFTAVSYAELSARLPKSAGEAAYVYAAVKKRWVASGIGWLIIFTGVVSAATIANGFVGYLNIFVQIEPWLAMTLLIGALGLLAFWGIGESIAVVTVITLLEVFGLLLVLWVGRHSLLTLPDRIDELIPSLSLENFSGIALGGFLAFYAYIGFEDMVNIAEEVKEPEKNLPRGIFLALGISTLLYLLVGVVAVLAIPLSDLAASDAPLALIITREAAMSPTIIGLISLFAVVNGALVQIIMASRVAYGMAMQGFAFSCLGHVNERTQTPALATAVVAIAVLIFALGFPLITLAKATSFIILLVFSFVNLSLIILKKREPRADLVSYPSWVPVVGFVLCIGLLVTSVAA